MATKGRSFEDDLSDLLAECYADPLKYVMSMFPWETDASIQLVKLAPEYRSRFKGEWGPDKWACEFLDQLGADIRDRAFDGRRAVDPIQYAVASGHGIGKSTLVAWIVKFIMDTRPHAKGTVTANTADQLRAKTWAEVGKWHKLSLTSHRFDYRSGRGSMSLSHKQAPETWACKATTCREEDSEAFAGQHAGNSTSFYVFDEASNIHSKIFEVREGGLTDGEPMTFDFGNPTRNTGAFYESCEGNTAHRYRRWNIDSRSVAITNKAYLDRVIQDFGINSDRVKVRVKGEFPAISSSQFISVEMVKGAMERELFRIPNAALVLGVDVGGRDGDESVIKARMGDDARSWPAKRFSGLDTVQLVGQIITTVNEFRGLGVRCAGIFIDAGGIGAGVYDQLHHLGYNAIAVQFGASASDIRAYRRLGDEMWGKMRDALQTRLCLPYAGVGEADDLRTQLTQREFGYMDGGQIHLESKREMKERGIQSPDIADALALTYAREVAPLDEAGLTSMEPRFCVSQYDVFERYS